MTWCLMHKASILITRCKAGVVTMRDAERAGELRAEHTEAHAGVMWRQLFTMIVPQDMCDVAWNKVVLPMSCLWSGRTGVR